MIKKLRRKFVLINMSLVTAVLFAVVAVSCISGYQNSVDESKRALERAWASPPKFVLSDRWFKPPEESFSLFPVFGVTLDQSGEIISVTANNVEVSDELVLQAVKSALSTGGTEGVLGDLMLRYRIEQTPSGLRLAFVDRTRELQSLLKLLLTSLAALLGGFAAFLAVSLYLSRWALRPVEQAWEQQRQFVADASHELKTPLTVILANTGILLSHQNDSIAQQHKWIENTQAEAERMKKLVDDLLFLAKSDAVSAPVPHTRLDFSDLMWSSVLPFESVAFEQGVKLDSDIPAGVAVQGDAGQLRQVAAILLDNACKYAGEKGKVFVQLEAVQDKVRLKVNNTGTPIPPEKLKHVFERFYRADASRAREKGGYGLGLAIAQSIIAAHKGSITAQSDAQNGTTFIVTLPKP